MGYYGGLTIDFDDNYHQGGFAVSGIGDINGDGIEDFAVTERFGYGNYYTNTGTVYVVFGQAAETDPVPVIDAGAFPLELSVSELDGTNGFKLNPDPVLGGGFYYEGPYGATTFGSSIAALGDVNGDGFDDFGVGQDGTYSSGGFYGEYGYSGNVAEGVAYVIFGGTDIGGSAVTSVVDLEHARIDADGEITGIIGLGDVDGDGIDDIGINEERFASETQVENVYFYDADGEGDFDEEPSFTRYVDVQVNDVTGYVIFGINEALGESFGNDAPIAPEGGSYDSEIIRVDQLDGSDGFSVDAGQAIGGTGGFYGGEYGGPALAAFGGTVVGDDYYGSNSGAGIQGAVDIDGDGFADVIVNTGAYDAQGSIRYRSPGEESYYNYYSFGTVETFIESRGIIDGSGTVTSPPTEVVDLTVTSPRTFEFEEDTAPLGNVSGDDAAQEFGVTGFALASDFPGELAGLDFVDGVYVANGATDAFATSNLDLSPANLDGNGAFFFSSEERDDAAGRAAFTVEGLLGVGNMIGSAADDFMILGNHFQPDTGFQRMAYIVAGTEAERTGVFDLEQLVSDGDAYKIFGGSGSGFEYLSASAAGDVNDDGFDDVVLGSPFADDGNGDALVIFGGAALEAADVGDGTNDNILLADNTEVDLVSGLVPIRLSIENIFIFQDEGTGAPTDFEFTITRNGDLNATVSFDFEVIGGGAFAASEADGADFVGGALPNGTVTFAAGSATATVLVQVEGDSEVESSEDFTVILSNAATDNGASITIEDNEGFGFIRNDDEPVTFRVASTSVTESDEDTSGDVPLTFVITRSGETDVAATVDYQLVQSTATDLDFSDGFRDPTTGELMGGTLVFDATETEKTVTLQVFGDEISENTESVGLQLSNPQAPDSDNEAVIAPFSDFATGFIFDDDVPVRFRASASNVTEGDPGDDRTLTITVTRSGVTDVEASVDFSLETSGGSNAADADDFVDGFPQTGTLTFLATEISKTVTATVRGDNDVESNESVRFVLSNATTVPGEDAQIDTEVISPRINNDDQPMFFRVGPNQSVIEGDAGETLVTLRVTRSGETSEAGSVDYAVERYFGTNSADADDFASVFPDSGTLNFAAGDTVKEVEVRIQADLQFEADELFEFQLLNPVGSAEVPGQILDATAFVTIRNDDQPENVTISAVSLPIDEDEGTLTFTVNRSGGIGNEVTVDFELAEYQVAVGNRADSSDFSDTFPRAGTLTFGANETQKTITLQVIDDEIQENTEYVELRLSNLQTDASGTEDNVISTPLVYGTIDDDDIPVRYSVNGSSVVEGAGGASTIMSFTVSRSGDVSSAGTVDYEFRESASSNNATADDFVEGLPQAGTVSFGAGQRLKTIQIEVDNDDIVEGTELFEVVISNPTATDTTIPAEIARGSATGYIYDDDFPVQFRVSGSNVVEGEPGAGNTLLFTVTRSGETGVGATVDYEVAGGTADADDFDSTFPTGVQTLTFDPLETFKTVELQITGDDAIEANEFTEIQLSNPESLDPTVDAVLLGSSARATIRNDDFDAQIRVVSASVTEGDSDADARELTFVVFRSGDTQSTVEVDYEFRADAFNPLSAADFEDGLPQSGTLIFDPDETSKTVSFAIAEDTDVEANERGIFSISDARLQGATNSDGVTVLNASASGVVNNDDIAPRIVTYLNGSLYRTSVLEGQPGDNNVVDVRFVREGSTEGTVTLTYDLLTNAGSVVAADSQDIVGFLPSFGNTVDFADGESEQIVTIQINGDGLIEANEGFRVAITDVESIGGPSYDLFNPVSFITIINDDGRPPLPELPFDVDGDGEIEDGEVITVEADVFGDPHITTLDGLGYDFQAVGEYVLVETRPGAENPFSVQVRFEAFPGSDLVSVTTRMAVEVKGRTIEIDALGDDPLLIDGVAPDADDLAVGAISLGGDDFYDVFVDGDKYFILLNESGEQLMIGVMDGSLNVCVFLGDPGIGGNAGNVRGLMGNANGDLSDDFELRSPTEVIPDGVQTVDAEGTPSLTFDYLYGFGDYEGGGYRASWALADGESLFSGDTPDFPENFPAAPLSVDNLPDDIREAAEQAARDAGLDPDENPVVFESAVLDFALTGLDAFLGGATQLAATPEAATEAAAAPELTQTVGVSAEATSVVEGDAGVQTLNFTFYRLGDTTGALEVEYAIVGDVDADDLGVDSTGSVVFEEGETSVNLEVLVNGDLTTEDDEALTVSITGTSVEGVLIGGAQGQTIIETDDFGPVAEDDVFSSLLASETLAGNLVDEDNGNGADSDEDGDALTVTKVFVNGGEAPADGTPIPLVVDGDNCGLLTVSEDGDVTFDPDGDFAYLADGEVATVSFDYEVSDGNGGTDIATASITIVGENEAPEVDGPVTGDGDEDTGSFDVNLLAGASDVDGGTPAVDGLSLISGDASGVTDNGDTLSVDTDLYELEPGEIVTIEYGYNVIDGQGGSTPQTATITITGTNDEPTVGAAITSDLTEDTGSFDVNLLAGASDVDGGTPAVDGLSLISGDASGVTDNGDTLSVNTDLYELEPGEIVTIEYGYNVIDGQGGSTPQTATITITGTNDAPTVGAAITSDLTEDTGSFDVNLLDGASDVDGGIPAVDGLNLISGDGSGVTDNGNTLSVNTDLYELAPGEIETIEYSYNVIDGQGGSTPQTAIITITGAAESNLPPIVEATVFADVNEDTGPFEIDLLQNSSDPEGEDLSLLNSSITGPSGRPPVAATVSALGIMTIDPGQFEDLGEGETIQIGVTFDVSDGDRSTPGDAVITVIGENDLSEFTSPDDFTVAENQTVVGTVTVEDPDTNDDIEFSLSGDDGALFEINPDTGELSFVAPPDFEAPADQDGDNVYEVQVNAFDGTDTVTEDVTVTVTNVDEVDENAVIGGDGRDNLEGTDADEVFVSGGGSYDRMTGGGGNDVFVFGDELDNGARERDVITDFAEGDTILLATDNFVMRDISSGVYIRHNDDFDSIYVLGDIDTSTINIEIGTYDPFV